MFTDRKLLSVVKVSVILNLISRFSAIPVESVILYILANWFESLYKETKDPQQPTQYWKRRTKPEDWHSLTSGLPVKRQ